MKTDIFLDVDGVFNAFAWNASHQAEQHWPVDPVTAPINGYRFTWFEAVIDWINQTEAREDVQFHWLTTWRSNAPRLVAPVVGINGATWPVFDGDDEPASFNASWGGTREPAGWWKLSCVESYFGDNPDCRVVWIDDDLFDSQARAFAKPLEEQGRIILIQPSPHLGLTPAHLTNINAFLEEA